VAIAVGAVAWWWSRPVPVSHPGYHLDLALDGEGPFRAGASRVPITPILDPEGDPVWLAGYQTMRAATGVHDHLWARALVIQAGEAKIALVAVDLIGVFQHEVITIREALDPQLEIDHVIVASTHTHSGPDTIGLWGRPFRTGVRIDYNRRVQQGVVRAITRAADALTPVTLTFARKELDPAGLLRDSRKPVVMDAELAVLEVRRWGDDEAIATVVNWSCHPEVLDSSNTRVTSDFPHYLREALEADRGGIGIFLAGSVGGLQTPLEVKVLDPEGTVTPEASFAKAQALGLRLAEEATRALEEGPVKRLVGGPIRVRARTVKVPLENRVFRLAAKLGVIRRGVLEGFQVRTEVGVLVLGSVPFLCLPGEVYPEIVVGGIESPPGGDFGLPPQEIPPLEEAMRDALGGEIRFILGMANDEIGYLIPKSEWDVMPPYLYGAESSPYGEINSVGPDAAPILHREALNLVQELAKDR
jgi:hypothetical protein